MSIQVKRRREAASFLSTFTGAQAELIVDTTNNRVQVHDGVTAGGWPAAKLSEVVANTRTAVSDANYAALATDRTVAYTAITAARSVTLPASSAYPTGTRLLILDESGACSATNAIAVSAAGSDAVDGAGGASIKTPYGYLALQSNGSGKWTITDASSLTGGTIDDVVIGGTTPAAASVTAPGAGDSSQRAITSAWHGQNLPGGMLNKFRNGTMDVWQRGAAPMAVATAGAYTADGWIVVPSGASCGAQVGAGRSPTVNSLQVYGGSSVTDVVVKQRIESYIAAPLSGQMVTVQAQVWNNTGASITPTLTVKHAGSQDVWSSQTTDVSAVALQPCAYNAWTRIAYTFAASSSSSLGLEISFDFGNNFGSSSKSIQVTELDIRVTPGVSAGQNGDPPPPELRPIMSELAFCQRYLPVYKAWPGESSGWVIAFGGAISATMAFATLWFPVQTRTPPTGITFSALSDFNFTNGAGATQALTSIIFNTAYDKCGTVVGTIASGFTTGQFSAFEMQTSTAQLIFTGAEL